MEGATANALSQGASDMMAVAKVFEEERERVDTALAEDAFNQYAMKGTELQFGEQGFTRVKGAAAVKTPLMSDYSGKLKSVEDGILSTLSSPRQKELFKKRTGAYNVGFQQSALRHISQESDVFYKEVSASTLENVKIQAANDPSSMPSNLVRLDADISREAERQGLMKDGVPINNEAADIIGAMRAKQRDSLWTSTLQAWKDKDPVMALAAYQQFSEDIAPGHRAALGKTLFEAAKPVLASQLLSGELRTSAKSDDEAVAIMREAQGMGLPASVKVMKDGMKAEAGSNPLFDSLPVNLKIEVMEAARTQNSQNKALMRQDMDDRVRDATASYLSTGTFPTPPTKEEFVAVYGPDRGEKAYNNLEDNRRLGEAVQRVSLLGPQEKQELLKNSKPVPGDGFASAEKRYEYLEKAIQESNTKLLRDPSGYVVTTSPIVKQSYADLTQAMSSQNPTLIREATQKYAMTSMAEQRRLGVDNPVLLPKAMAEQEVANFNREIGNGDNVATRITIAEKQWGKYWPTVYRQLATEFKGNLPDSFLTIPGLNSNAAKEEVARLDHVKLEDLKKQVEPTNVKSITEKIQQELAPLAESLLANQTNSDLYQAINQAATKMALVRVQKGQSVGNAVEAAVTSFTGNYEFSNAASVSRYRIPKDENPGMVKTGVNRIISKISLIDISPPSEGDATTSRKPDEISSEWKTIVIANPVWVTNSDDSGLKLYAIGKDGRQYPVNTKNDVVGQDGNAKLDQFGRPVKRQVEYTWDQLRSMAEADPAFGAAGTDMRQVQKLRDEEKARQRQQQAERDRLIGER
jgi:hypothetical protein